MTDVAQQPGLGGSANTPVTLPADLPEDRSIAVTNVEAATPNPSIIGLLSHCGDINRLFIYTNGSAPTTPKSVICEFSEAVAVDAALLVNGTDLRGINLSITKYDPSSFTLPPSPVVTEPRVVTKRYATGPIATNEATAAAVAANPQLQAVLANLGASKLTGDDVVMRTIYCGNLVNVITPEQLTVFFSGCGTVTAVKLAGDALQPTRYAFCEFAEKEAVQLALGLTGQALLGRPIKVNYSSSAITRVPSAPQLTAPVGNAGVLPNPAIVAGHPGSNGSVAPAVYTPAPAAPPVINVADPAFAEAMERVRAAQRAISGRVTTGGSGQAPPLPSGAPPPMTGSTAPPPIDPQVAAAQAALEGGSSRRKRSRSRSPYDRDDRDRYRSSHRRRYDRSPSRERYYRSDRRRRSRSPRRRRR